MNFEVPDIQQLSRGPRNQGLLVYDLDINIWNWPQGVGLYGLEKLQTYYGDQRYDDFLDGWFRRQLREGEPIRNINTTAPYLVLQALADRTENETYHEMCTRRANWLMNGLPRTRENGFQHVVQDLNNQQLWVDTLFMSVLFLAREGKRQGRYDWCQEAVHQILVHIKYLYDKKTRLLFHGWSFERMDNFGGIYWGRGNSWFSYGILELLENLEDTLDGGTREFMLETYEEPFAPHFAQFRHGLALCQHLGCTQMRMFSFFMPEGMDTDQYKEEVAARLEQMLDEADKADKAGVHLMHENEKGIFGYNTENCAFLLERFGDRMGFIFDPANFVQCGVDTLKAFDRLHDRISYLHIKDALSADGAVVRAGYGDGNVEEILRRLNRERSGELLLTIEPHLTVFEGLGKLQQEVVRHHEIYPSQREAFHAACEAVRHLLTKVKEA